MKKVQDGCVNSIKDRYIYNVRITRGEYERLLEAREIAIKELGFKTTPRETVMYVVSRYIKEK